jgi:hypothetical protein
MIQARRCSKHAHIHKYTHTHRQLTDLQQVPKHPEVPRAALEAVHEHKDMVALGLTPALGKWCCLEVSYWVWLPRTVTRA